MIFKTKKHSIAYITDTRYFEKLADYYHGDLLMINLTFNEARSTPQRADMPLDHLSVVDAEKLIKDIKPKITILTHFGMGVWRAKPWLIAEKLTEQTGVKVIAARDGMKFDLVELDKT
jgi:ribonuclease BN (tRNA processing enzyme)